MEKKEILNKFGLRLREIRTIKNITQESLADRCKLDRTYISGLERGIRNPSLACIFRVAKGLDIEAEELIKGLNLKNE
ncbi:MAG TPA: helix-turn-helix transcriptional regulator [Marinospirillum sp.]|uniref:helix-turn-helix domain-containing protein n=1 Tax=Marinospirillum sp. TaxID=2183934 RepID=UPI002B47DC34|nr:helix-turn-helix transcriptional regulator [Marinospirillum sp.]HKM16379.1 helix-turn-helix transcriptional regulator [Marinospirillum sp.]